MDVKIIVDEYNLALVIVELTREQTLRVVDTFKPSRDEFREHSGFRVWDSFDPEDESSDSRWVVLMSPLRATDMVGVGRTYGSDRRTPTGYGITIEVEVKTSLDYTRRPETLDLDARLAVAATLRPLLALAGIEARPN